MASSGMLRQRMRAATTITIHEPPPPRLPKQVERIEAFEVRWKEIHRDLPPQLSRRHSEHYSPEFERG